MEHISTNMDIDILAFQIMMLQYRNTLTMPGNMSQAQIMFSHPIRDFILIKPGHFMPCTTWQETAKNREFSMMERHSHEIEFLMPYTKCLPPLNVGDRVWLQNQMGKSPQK
jgi:hypothetical protein